MLIEIFNDSVVTDKTPGANEAVREKQLERRAISQGQHLWDSNALVQGCIGVVRATRRPVLCRPVKQQLYSRNGSCLFSTSL